MLGHARIADSRKKVGYRIVHEMSGYQLALMTRNQPGQRRLTEGQAGDAVLADEGMTAAAEPRIG